MVLQLTGRVDENGKLIVDIPPGSGLAAGDEVAITVHTYQQAPTEAVTYTEAELNELIALLKPNPKTGAEIVASGVVGAWADENIASGVGWTAEQRERRAAKNRW